MRLINANALIVLLINWWYLSYLKHDAMETKTIEAVIDKIDESLDDLELKQRDDVVILDKKKILQEGYKHQEVEFRIDGRLFSVREKAQ